jgi:hypothetical protein
LEAADSSGKPGDFARAADLDREMTIGWGVTERELFEKATGTPDILSRISRAIWKTP